MSIKQDTNQPGAHAKLEQIYFFLFFGKIEDYFSEKPCKFSEMMPSTFSPEPADEFVSVSGVASIHCGEVPLTARRVYLLRVRVLIGTGKKKRFIGFIRINQNRPQKRYR